MVAQLVMIPIAFKFGRKLLDAPSQSKPNLNLRGLDYDDPSGFNHYGQRLDVENLHADSNRWSMGWQRPNRFHQRSKHWNFDS